MSPDNGNLRAALRALAEETAGAGAPDRVRRALEAEVRARARRRVMARWWPAAAAAALAIGIWLGRPAPTQPAPAAPVVAAVETAPAPAEAPPEPALAPRARLASASAAAPSAAVSPWFFYAGLPPAQRGQVVRIRVNAATAAHFGVFRGDDEVPAQVFIGDDGVARAIRFVR